MKTWLRATLLSALITPALAPSAQATDLGLSLTIGEPGFYGRIDIGDVWRPQLVYPRPVIIIDDDYFHHREPVYLRVPAAHRLNWRHYCYRYEACHYPVFFVDDYWYQREYAPWYVRTHHHHNYSRPVVIHNDNHYNTYYSNRYDANGDKRDDKHDRGHDDRYNRDDRYDRDDHRDHKGYKNDKHDSPTKNIKAYTPDHRANAKDNDRQDKAYRSNPPKDSTKDRNNSNGFQKAYTGAVQKIGTNNSQGNRADSGHPLTSSSQKSLSDNNRSGKDFSYRNSSQGDSRNRNDDKGGNYRQDYKGDRDKKSDRGRDH